MGLYTGILLVIISELLHRTDFFPGLGWMLERNTWLELAPKWPETYVTVKRETQASR